MGDYGTNFNYGESDYKDEGPSFWTFNAIEPIIILTFENRCYYLSHRSDSGGRREYRLGEFLKRGQFSDKFIQGM